MSVDVGVWREWIPPQPKVERQFLIDAQVVLNEQTKVLEARVLIFADALREAGELTEEVVGERVAGEGRAVFPSELAVGAEVVHDVALAVAVIAAERQLMTPHGPTRRI